MPAPRFETVSKSNITIYALLLAGMLSLSPFSVFSAEKGKWVRLAPNTPGQPDAIDLSKTLPSGHPTAVRGELAVDRTTGALFVAACYWGLWKSTDHGETFARIDNGQIPGGGPSNQFALQVCPEDGGKMLLLSGGIGNPALPPCGLTTDGGKTWQTFGEIDRNYSKNMFLEVVAVDWKSSTVLGNGVQDGWGIYHSANAGKTWTHLPRGTHRYLTGAGVFGPTVFVICDGGGSQSRAIERSEDSGKTWEKVSDLGGVGPMQIFKGTAYWLSSKGSLITSKDEGKTWTVLSLSAPANIMRGPYFGKDEKQIVVVNEEGFSETTDGGYTWKLAAPNAPGHSPFLRDIPCTSAWREYDTSTVAFDPVGNIFYYLPTDGYLKDIWKFER
jgi:photosystem II stability/assembly factor-like uncharacterized protein